VNAVWYCTDCETRIDREEIDEHEADGHHVRGQLRPDRLIGNDPWNMTLEGPTTDERPHDEPDAETPDGSRSGRPGSPEPDGDRSPDGEGDG